MENLKNEENAVKKIYGEENLKDIITDLLEKTFIQEIKNQEVILKEQTHLPIGRSYKESLKEQN